MKTESNAISVDNSRVLKNLSELREIYELELDRIISKFEDLNFYIGNKKEYEKERGYETELIQIYGGLRRISFDYNREGKYELDCGIELKENLIENNIEAIIEVRSEFPNSNLEGHYITGYPIRRLEDKND